MHRCITEVMSGEREVLLVHLTLASCERIRATAHPLRTAEGWRDAQLIKAGGQLDLKGSTDEQPKRVEVVKVEHELKRERVYNLEVANAHTFFVGEEGVWGHNAKKGCELHHTIPRQILSENLPSTIANHPLVRGCKGKPNRWPIPYCKHREIHSGGGNGGRYNDWWRREIQRLEDVGSLNVQSVCELRERAAEEFGLGNWRPY